MLTVQNFNNVKNQFIITDTERNIITFQSYNTTVATLDEENQTLKIVANAYDFSKTTSKYLNRFIEEFTHLTPKSVQNRLIPNANTYFNLDGQVL